MVSFPTKALIFPPLLPLAVWAVATLFELGGHQFNVHGDFMLVLAALLFLGLIWLLIEAVAVPMAWGRLRQYAKLRTAWHYTALGIGTVYLLVACSATLWFFAQPFLVS